MSKFIDDDQMIKLVGGWWVNEFEPHGTPAMMVADANRLLAHYGHEDIQFVGVVDDGEQLTWELA